MSDPIDEVIAEAKRVDEALRHNLPHGDGLSFEVCEPDGWQIFVRFRKRNHKPDGETLHILQSPIGEDEGFDVVVHGGPQWDNPEDHDCRFYPCQRVEGVSAQQAVDIADLWRGRHWLEES